VINIKPEIHDIGKLIDNSIIKHNFENYPGNLDGAPPIKMNPIWEGILQHHCTERDEEYPKSFKTFVLSVADSVAAVASRHYKEKVVGHNVYKLWNPPRKNIRDLSEAIGRDTRTLQWITRIVEFVNKYPSVEDFFETFGKYLKLRAEDAKTNITSLWTHSKLTGLFYRFLYDYLEEIDDEWFQNASKEEIRKLIDSVKKNTKVEIVKIKINFPQHPVRIRDLNVFDVLKEVKNEILEKYPDNVIFVGFNELLLILPLDKKLEETRGIISKYGFWFEYIERIQNLNQLYPNLDRDMRKTLKELEHTLKKRLPKIPINKRKEAEEGIRKSFFKEIKKAAIHPDLSPQITPPICEICQLNQATEKWVDEESGIVENLCVNCFNIRKRGSRFPKLDEWEKEGANRILWIRVGLNINQLVNVLEDLYAEYLRSLGVREPEERAEIRFSVLSEFDWDYKEFLDKFRNKLLEVFGEDNFQQILEEFVSVRIKDPKDIRVVLRIFDEIFTEFFPKFKEIESPVKLGIICSSIKYPFLESWRILSDLKYETYVSVIGKGEIKLNLSQLTSFLEIDARDKALLYKLTAVSEISEKLAEIVLYDRSDRDYKKYKPLRDAVKKFGFQNILTYAKIMGG